MKKIIVFLFACATISSYAQSFRDDFETNMFGWNELSEKRGEAIIKNGVLHLSAGTDLLGGGRSMMSTCYLPVDTERDFTITAKCVNTKINDNERGISIVLNYMDDFNYDEFIITKETAMYRRWVENKCVGFRQAQVKVNKKLKDHVLQVKSTVGKLEFVIDNMTAIEIKFAPIKYSGFGLGVFAYDGKQVADIDEIEIIQ